MWRGIIPKVLLMVAALVLHAILVDVAFQRVVGEDYPLWNEPAILQVIHHASIDMIDDEVMDIILRLIFRGFVQVSVGVSTVLGVVILSRILNLAGRRGLVPIP